MKSCPLWSVFSAMGIERQQVRKGTLSFGTYKPLEVQPCIGEECGMYKLCNPGTIVVAKEGKKEKKKLRTFGGGFVEEDQD